MQEIFLIDRGHGHALIVAGWRSVTSDKTMSGSIIEKYLSIR
jgi:hypothetical protein